MVLEKFITLAFDRLDALFRYVLPGVVVLGVTYAAHPSWFCWYDPSNSHDIFLLAVLTISGGAVVYCVQRFSVHQGLDYISWRWLNKLGKRYRDDLLDAVKKGTGETGIDRHIALRSSQLILLFIFAEATLVFSFSPEPGSVIYRYRCWALTVAAAVLVFAIWQYTLVNDLDRRAGRPETKKSS